LSALITRLMLAGAVLAGVGLSSAGADDYPAKPIRLIVGFTAGAAGDVLARVVAADMGKQLGQALVVEDKPGAGSNIAAEYVAQAPKDGYTLLLGTVANATATAVTPNLRYDFVKDFTPIGMAAILPVLLVVHPSLDVHSLPELVALAKSKPNQILYASTGVGTTPHLAGELLNTLAGIKMVHVPYQGSPSAVTDLIAGRTQVMFASASTVLPFVKSGALVALATAAPKRTAAAPDLPTTAELGMPSLDASIWFGIMTPAGVSPDIKAKLARALAETMKSKEVLATLASQGFDPLTGPPEQFANYIQDEIKKWSAVANAAGARN
jgi:tripartite-type tricarboxylate transporter receptor subunit TctC